MPSPVPPPSARTTVRRLPERGSYDRATAHAILDEGLVAHVGLTTDDGPVVIPLLYGRDGDRLLLHGSAASRLLRGGAKGAEMCVTVTLVDGLVLARSAFHHSMNYRSVVAFGRATPVTDPDEKRAALDRLVEHIVPGRTADARPPADKEIRATLVLALPLDECSVKVRTGGPNDEDEDMDLPVWAGVVPLSTVAGAPVAAGDLRVAVPVPGYAARYTRPSARGTRAEAPAG
ncbi:MAG TPA: pyridoxamine 5'-phosphate oxidase family protein [Acidimicrobiales bacterium]|nr:pyridoxamine 5'-phosphate oxidase family protein [Acidimicrobiales bacterium]